MSRIGNKPITVPAGVDVAIDGASVTVKGPKGTLSRNVNPAMSLELDGSTLKVIRPDDTKEMKAMHGLTRTLVANMIQGVHQEYSKSLEIVGVGYRAALEGKDLVLTVGYSHPVKMAPPEGITIEVPAPAQIKISGADKQQVGQFASEVRKVRPPEPYKGKGIRYEGEFVRHKEGKAGKGAK